ncbi:MAG: Rib/alpha-like domain-containing protein, partial [Peptoniphilus harei]
MNNITNFKTRKNQITKSFKKLIVFLLVMSLALPSLTEGAWAAANPPGAMLRDNQARAGEAPWKPDDYENGSDAAVMSRTGFSPLGSINFSGKVKNIYYAEKKDETDNFNWSRKPGGNDNIADELIRVNARFDKKTNTIHWNIIVKGNSGGPLFGLTKDLTGPFFIIAVSRGLESPKNLYVSNGSKKMPEYPGNWKTLESGKFRMFDVNEGSRFDTWNGRRILGKTWPTQEFLQEKYRLPCTGADKDKSMAYNIEKYTYYSKYAILDNQGALNEANTRMYSFTTEINEGDVATQGELPNVDSEFTQIMGWGKQRNNVDLTGKVWITVGVTSREAFVKLPTPHGGGNYNFTKIAVVDVKPNEDKLGLEPFYKEGSGKAGDTVNLPINLKDNKQFPKGTRFMLESDPKDNFYTNPNTGGITQTPAVKKDKTLSIDPYTGKVTVNIPKGARGGQEIKDNVHVIYPDGSTHIVPLVVKVIEDKPNIKRGSFATNPRNNEKQLDKEPFGDIYMGDAVLKYTYQAGDTSRIIKSFTADGLPSGTTFGDGSPESSTNAPDENDKRLQRPLALKADTKAKVGDFAITFKAVNGSGKETTATNPGVIKTYVPTNNGTRIRIKKDTPKDKIPSPKAAIGIYHKKYTNPDDIRNELKHGATINLIKKNGTAYLPEGTTYTWKSTPDTDVVGESLNYAIVKYTDKNGKEIVDEVPVYVDVYDTDDVIPYTPKDVTKPTNEKDKNVPKKDSKNEDVDVNDYNIVAFKTEDKTKGTLTKDKEQNKEVISVLVKKNKFKLKTFGSIKPTVNTATDYTFWFWDKDPANEKKAVNYTDYYASKDVYTAYFIKSGDEIKEVDKNIPLPNGFHKVTIAKGDGIEDNQLFGKTYAVKEGEKLSKDKFPNLTPQASYKEPKWNVGNPWNQTMGKTDVIYTATATQKTTAEKIENLGGIEGKDLAAWVGDKLDSDFWKKGVVAKSTIPDNITKMAVEEAIKAATKVEDVTKTARTTNAEVLNPTNGKLRITFADNSSLEVEQKLYVYAKKTTKPTDSKQPTPKDAVEVAYNKGDGVKGLQGTGKTLVKSGETLAAEDFPKATLNEGHKDVTWSGQTAGNPKDYKVTENNKVFTATATKIDYTTDSVIPFEPKDPEKPGDKDDKNIPTENPKDKKPIKRDEYVVVGFKVDPKNSGTLTLGDQANKAVISALVKKGTEWAKFTMPTTNNANDYVFWHWNEAPAGNVADGQVRVAKFITNGQEITPGTTLPDGVFAVKVSRDETSIKANGLYGKSYAVFKDSKLAKDKFPTPEAADNFKEAKWNVEKPWDQAITKNAEF